jgi:hypothetical protein
MTESVDELRAFLTVRDAACPRCGYNLRGLQEPVCPECGASISLQALKEREEFLLWRERRMPTDPINTFGFIGALLGVGWPVVFLVVLRELSGVWPVREMAAAAAIVQFPLIAVYARARDLLKWQRGRKMVLALVAWGWGPLVLTVVAVTRVMRGL